MILVTGGSGLLGSELIRQLLERNQPVRALFNKTPLPDFGSPLLEQFQCDVLDTAGLEEAMLGIKEVYHCAGMVSFHPSRKYEMFKINVEGTANVVNAALNEGIEKMVHVSSVAALGRPAVNTQVTETMSWTDASSSSNYGNSKYLGELEVWRGIGEGLNAVMVNPVIILGKGNWQEGSSQLFKTVYDEFPWYTGGSTGFVAVQDVAQSMIALMQSTVTAERFIVSAGNKTYREIFNLIADGFGKKRPYKKVTPLIAQLVWRLEAVKSWLSGSNPLLTKETAASAQANTQFDNSKLLRFLPGFRYTPIETTIKQTCDYLLAQLKPV